MSFNFDDIGECGNLLKDDYSFLDFENFILNKSDNDSSFLCFYNQNMYLIDDLITEKILQMDFPFQTKTQKEGNSPRPVFNIIKQNNLVCNNKILTRKRNHSEDCSNNSSINNNTIFSDRLIKTKFSKEEDNLLIKLVEQNLNTSWKQIALYFQGKTALQCFNRYNNALKPTKKGKWTNAEDKQILDWVDTNGSYSWGRIGIKGRTAKQIRERWVNYLSLLHQSKYLNGNIECKRKFQWDSAKEKLLVELFQQYGSKWTVISKQISGSSENIVKNKFYCLLRQIYNNSKPTQTPLNKAKINENCDFKHKKREYPSFNDMKTCLTELYNTKGVEQSVESISFKLKDNKTRSVEQLIHILKNRIQSIISVTMKTKFTSKNDTKSKSLEGASKFLFKMGLLYIKSAFSKLKSDSVKLKEYLKSNNSLTN